MKHFVGEKMMCKIQCSCHLSWIVAQSLCCGSRKLLRLNLRETDLKMFLIFSHYTCFYFISSQPLHSAFLSFLSLAIFHSISFCILPLIAFHLSPPHLWLCFHLHLFLSLPPDYSTALLQKSTEGLARGFWEQSFFFCGWWLPDAGDLLYLEICHSE